MKQFKITILTKDDTTASILISAENTKEIENMVGETVSYSFDDENGNSISAMGKVKEILEIEELGEIN